MSPPEPTADFYPIGPPAPGTLSVVPFSAVVAARPFGYESAMLLESCHGRIRIGAGELHHRTAALIRNGDVLIAARCGSIVYDFMESLLLSFKEDNAAAAALRAAIPATWHKLYADNAAHIAASRGYRQ